MWCSPGVWITRYWGCIGTMEKKMESTRVYNGAIWGLGFWVWYWGFRVLTLRFTAIIASVAENQSSGKDNGQ